jgi:hypothetical protein
MGYCNKGVALEVKESACAIKRMKPTAIKSLSFAVVLSYYRDGIWAKAGRTCTRWNCAFPQEGCFCLEAKEWASVVRERALVKKGSASAMEGSKEGRGLVVKRCTPLVKEHSSVVKERASGLL